jgi:hypothetical protein
MSRQCGKIFMSSISQTIVFTGVLAAIGGVVLAFRWRRTGRPGAAASGPSSKARLEPQWRHSQIEPDTQSGRI